MVKKLLLTVFLLLVQAVVFAATYTFNGTTNSDWNNGANWSGGIIAPTAPGNGDIIIINANVNVGSITIGNGATLKVNAPATLTVGPVGTSATTQVVDFQNGCIVVIESGASLVVNGLLNNSNNSKGVTFNGSVSVTGNVTAGNGSTIVGTGTLDTTGSIITDSPTGSIFGSTGDCLNGPCSGSQLNCSGESNMISSNQTICRGNTPATLIGSTTINPATYQWQESTTSGANFSDILGATSSNYPPGSLTTTTYYRRKQTVGGCTGTSSQVTVTVNALPTTPAAGTVSQPTCATATGTFQITGFDSARTYTFTPAVVSTSDTGLVTANAGTYTFTVNNAAGCTSLASANIVVNAQPATPSAPTVGTMTQPTCTVSTGSVVLNSLPSGSWTINPGNITGSTTSRTITGLAAGTTFNYTVTNSVGCTSGASANVVINAQPATPSAPTVGTINQPTCTVATGSVVLNGLPSGSWTINPGNIAGSTTSTTIAGLAAETTFNYTVTNAAGCTSVASANVVINAQPTTPSAPTVGTITQPTCTVATGSVVLNGLPSGSWTINPGNITGSTTSATINGLTAGTTFNYTVTNSVGCTSVASGNVVVNAQPATPSAPTAGAVTQPTCATAAGTFQITAFDAARTYTFTPAVVSISGTGLVTANAGTYTFTVNNASGCRSQPSDVVEIKAFVAEINTWEGVSKGWSKGTLPTADQKIVFDGPDLYTLNSDIVACSCQAKSDVKVLSGYTLTLTKELTVTGLANVVFEDGASLLQTNNVVNVNTGNIYYKRSTNARKTDYTYWSSPVSNQTLGKLYPTGSIFYSYEVSAAREDWKKETAGTSMKVGKGYIANQGGGIPSVTMPPPGLLGVVFVGIPNNGHYEIDGLFEKKSYLLGNPYPSALDADKFLTDNAAVLDGTLYFWTHNTAIQVATNITGTKAGSGVYAYTSDDYASYNITGGVGTGTAAPSSTSAGSLVNKSVPTGKIASGQGFFASSKLGILSNSKIIYDNTMRVGVNGITGDNSQFFKTKNPTAKIAKSKVVEKNRIWLNLTNTQGAFKQTLVGYITDATNDYDNLFDGESFDGNEFVDFYSVNQDKNLVIQGRALPFDENDEVPLGFRTTINGAFTINIDQVDGFLANQTVFIEDKLTNTVFDLKSGNYTFNTIAGTFDDRFVLKYMDTSKTLTVDTIEKEDGILAFYSSNYNTLIIHNENFDETVNSVALFNMAGQKIGVWDVKDSEQTNIQIPVKNISSGIYIVKVTTTKGESSKKIIVN